MVRLSSSRADMDKMWMPIMKCPRCGYTTTSTNICRQCRKTPADHALNPEMVRVNLPCPYDGKVHWVTKDGKRYPAGHGYVSMVYTGRVQETFVQMKNRTGSLASRQRTRAYQPKDADEAQSLWVGTGVVFD